MRLQKVLELADVAAVRVILYNDVIWNKPLRQMRLVVVLEFLPTQRLQPAGLRVIDDWVEIQAVKCKSELRGSFLLVPKLHFGVKLRIAPYLLNT